MAIRDGANTSRPYSRVYGKRYLTRYSKRIRMQKDRKLAAVENGKDLSSPSSDQNTKDHMDNGGVVGNSKYSMVLKRILPHLLLLIAASLYTVAGGYAFYVMEKHFRPNTTNPYADSDLLLTTPSERPQIQKREIQLEDCSDELRIALVENAHRECLKNDTSTVSGEDPRRYCAILLRRLSACLGSSNHGSYGDLNFWNPTTTTTTTTPAPVRYKDADGKIRTVEWTPSTCIFMAFTIISTIGYGDVAPVTDWGKIFCIAYGLIGIPLALLAVADQGRFLTELVMYLYRKSKENLGRWYRGKKKMQLRRPSSESTDGQENEEDTMPAFLLIGLFALYMILGGYIFTRYESDWSFVDAVYFTFISSATVGFGDLIPANKKWLPLTLLYIALGLALATAAIDICAEYLRRLHHFGEKIRNAANKFIWFGGKRLTIAELVRSVGVQLGVDEEKIEDLMNNFDAIVEQTIQERQQQLVPEMPKESVAVPSETYSVQIPFIDSPCTSEKNSIHANMNSNF